LARLALWSQSVTMVGPMDQDALRALAKLYPTLTPQELVEAKENWDRYLLLVWEIWEPELEKKLPTLTKSESSSTIKAKVDSPK